MTDCNKDTALSYNDKTVKILDDYRAFVDGLTSFDNAQGLDEIQYFVNIEQGGFIETNLTAQLLVAILTRVGNNFGNVTEKYDTLVARLADANEELIPLRKKLDETIIALGLKNDDVAQLKSKVEDHRKEFADYHNLSIGQLLDAKLKDLIGEATYEAVDNIEVDADDVQGLTYLIESECEDQLNGREVEADDVQGLSDYVNNHIDDAFNDATVLTTIQR